MIVIRSIKKLSSYIKDQKERSKVIGFVPTMGYLHQGHLSLVRRARKETDIVVMSIFVNPTQFSPREDFREYPRDLKRDIKLAESCGVDVIFYPSIKSMYPEGYLTYVDVEKITDFLCGRSRPGHFKGVCTVVVKLFNLVQPDIAYFGQKDFQQVIVIKKMVRDLNIPVKIKICSIIREEGGLAMSSRNTYLSEKEREDAKVIYEALCKAREMILKRERDPKVVTKQMKNLILSKSTSKIDYIAIVDTKNLDPLEETKGRVLVAVACWIGKTRLIDNLIVKA